MYCYYFFIRNLNYRLPAKDKSIFFPSKIKSLLLVVLKNR